MTLFIVLSIGMFIGSALTYQGVKRYLRERYKEEQRKKPIPAIIIKPDPLTPEEIQLKAISMMIIEYEKYCCCFETLEKTVTIKKGSKYSIRIKQLITEAL
jgi:hypothetical protein